MSDSSTRRSAWSVSARTRASSLLSRNSRHPDVLPGADAFSGMFSVASFQLTTGTFFIERRWSTVCLRPLVNSGFLKSLCVTRSCDTPRSMWEKRRSYSDIRALCPHAAAARREVSRLGDASSLRLWSCSGLLFSICSRRMRCWPDITAPDVTRITSRPLLTRASSCSTSIPIRESANLPSQDLDITFVLTFTTIRLAPDNCSRSGR
mmetsp:Transcript_12199/g.28953  ORF Transcript_12199/g.28953 Transcript_12199/m.28953 type:complete len:207 (-) Transcript_12199:431-1051(-)